MKLATLRDGTRDGRLVVVSRHLDYAVEAVGVAPTLQNAIERWSEVEPALVELYQALNEGRIDGAFAFDVQSVAAPLPRAYQWCDASAFLSHGERMQLAFGLEPINDVDLIPLMYQGASDDFLGPYEDVALPSEAHGIDIEGEFAVLVDDVPMGCPQEQAAGHIKLLVQLNDVSLRTLAPREMKTGFGFIQAKPATSFAPVAITPDELGSAWRDGRIHLSLHVALNGHWLGHPSAGEMHFSFAQLIAHAALTRRLHAGTVIGSGTVSNVDPEKGVSCLSEKRAMEMIDEGRPRTAFLQFGDRIRMEARSDAGHCVFGAIDQKIVCSIQSLFK